MANSIAIIGAGRVGSSIANAIILKNIASQIILIDIDQTRCKGELLDLSDSLPFSSCSTIKSGSIAQACNAGIVIVCAGKAQEIGQSRLELLEVNKKILHDIMRALTPLNSQTIIIIVTNPVDIMTYYAQQWASTSPQKIFGTGTFIDLQRLRELLSKRLHIAAQSIQGQIIGEHGDSQCIIWSTVTVNGIPLSRFSRVSEDDYPLIETEVRNRAYEIIRCKGSTHYGIAASVASICEAIIFNKKLVIPLSHFNRSFNLCLSMPVIIGKNGIEETVSLKLTEQEKEKLTASAKVIRSFLS